MARVRGGLGAKMAHDAGGIGKMYHLTVGLQGFWEDKEMESPRNLIKVPESVSFQFSSESFASKRYNFGFLLLCKLTLCIFKIIVFWLRNLS